MAQHATQPDAGAPEFVESRPLVADRAPTLRERLVPAMPAGGWRGWAGPLVVAALAALLRFHALGRPHAVIFDETYYAKDALSLLRFGYEKAATPNANQVLLDSNGNPPSSEVFLDQASFVVHPPVGKWLIALGEWAFGATPFGWRFVMAVLGTLSVLIVARVGRRLLRSNVLGTLAGLLLAIDGLSLVMSRAALLDTSLAFFVLLAFAALLIDRDRSRGLLADRVLSAQRRGLPASVGADAWLGWRPWRWVAMISLGLALATKWSAAWYLLAFGLLTVLWDLGARRAAGSHDAFSTTLFKDAIPTAIPWLVVPLAVYVGSWAGWFATSGGWARDWGENNPSDGFAWIPDSLRSLWHYHAEAYRFHVGLTSDHAYQANAWGWPLQARPTSFYYEEVAGSCGAAECAEEVLALGNPLIWWAGLLALIHQGWRWLSARDWRAGAVLCAFLAGWAPWLLFQERTIFEFYAIVYEPFMILALVLSIARLIQLFGRPAIWGIAAFLVVVIGVTAFYYPIWTGLPIDHEYWSWRMWLPSWV